MNKLKDSEISDNDKMFLAKLQQMSTFSYDRHDEILSKYHNFLVQLSEYSWDSNTCMDMIYGIDKFLKDNPIDD